MFSEPPAHAAYIWSRTSLVLQIQQVLHAARAWHGVVMERDHGGLRLVVGDETLGRLRWNGRLEVPFPAELRERLIGEGMAARDPEYSGGDQVVWIVRTPADADRAIWLLRLAYLRATEGPQAAN